MVHSNKLVVSLKVNNKFLRDYKDKDGNTNMYLPFGSEYSIFIKNLNTTRAVVDIDIDGKNSVQQVVVNPSCSIELERFLDNGNLNKGFKFKFIEKTDKIREHRGEQPEDGIVTVRYQFEKQVVRHEVTHVTHHYYDDYPKQWFLSSKDWPGNIPSCGANYRFSTSTRGMSSGPTMMYDSSQAYYSASPMVTAYVNSDGITVKGSESNQTFINVYVGELEEATYSIVIKLFGDVGQNKEDIKQPITTRENLKCKTCGTTNSSFNKFCRECGTNLLA
jgi:hypothetical protein